MTPISGRPVQVEAPPETKPTPVAPPAPKTPEMVAPAADGEAAAEDAAEADREAGRQIARAEGRRAGPEIKTGDARVDTGGAAIPFGGLTRPSGGGAPAAARTRTTRISAVPAYLNQMTDLIKRNWNQNQGAAGEVQMKFTIRRDGSLADVQGRESRAATRCSIWSRSARC